MVSFEQTFLSLCSSIGCPDCFRISLPVFKVNFFQVVFVNRILYDCILHSAHQRAQSPVITYIIVSDYGNFCIYMTKCLMSQLSDFLFELMSINVFFLLSVAVYFQLL